MPDTSLYEEENYTIQRRYRRPGANFDNVMLQLPDWGY